jgi:hypothetical protein
MCWFSATARTEAEASLNLFRYAEYIKQDFRLFSTKSGTLTGGSVCGLP